MNINIKSNSEWYHGSNLKIDVLRVGSTITQWKELAEAFSHKPTLLSYEENGKITHNGKETGYLYKIDEKITVGEDVEQHPKTTMDANAEFLTKRPLKLQLISIHTIGDKHNEQL
ncbi:hypothetical protein [Proteiniborus sp. MB09-C3]|uniref:hypothetical protein n=1 Tax=Proteiniborus sp. MB09-C3 TaxID=3050072 RepID=UPI0025550453|nr:hypothetical protein [Proteiniborus sp. MB09-C3]WIV12726.1 hypothetical protein QO263_03155 [Proteiniborus sp. MB09-C3]